MPTARRSLLLRILSAGLVCGLGFGLLGVGVVPGAAAAPRSGTAATALPTDPKVAGYIGFCDTAGHNVVGGDIGATPFAWKAVSSVAPPAAYRGAGQNAVLNAYQPRPGTPPSEWSGRSLTAASFYANQRRPAVQATYADLSLADFTHAFPARMNGLYVLRIFWGKRGYGLYNATYPATTIQVQGSRWHVVSGGTVDCSAAATRATSLEQLTGIATKRDVTPRAPATGQLTASTGTPRRITSSPGRVAAPSGATGTSTLTDGSSAGRPGATPTAAAASASSSTSSSGWVLWSLVAVVAVLAVLLALSARRRRVTPTTDPKD